MKRARLLGVALLLAAAAAALVLSGCGPKGRDGRAYLSLDWTYAPQDLYFPLLPPVISAGTYYPHPAGTYEGAYTAWDWTYYHFWYTIEINEGDYGFAGLPGDDGADRFYRIYLYASGPRVVYFDGPDMALAPSAAAGPALQEEARAKELGLQPPQRDSLENLEQERALDPTVLDLENPESYHYESSGPGWKVTIEGERYRPLAE
jgi:hypothetical protein